jgi:uncharacterized protein YoaH (UPF0181 family)
MTRAEEIAILADEIRKRRDGCPLLLAVQVLSAVVATGMSQGEVDEAFALADDAAVTIAQ